MNYKNERLTTEEVKDLKVGDIVWYEFRKEIFPIQFVDIKNDALHYKAFGVSITLITSISMINDHVYIYRKKPVNEDEEEEKEDAPEICQFESPTLWSKSKREYFMQRKYDIYDAIDICLKNNIQIPREWITELNEIMAELSRLPRKSEKQTPYI